MTLKLLLHLSQDRAQHITVCVKPSSGGVTDLKTKKTSTAYEQFISRSACGCVERVLVLYLFYFLSRFPK